MTPADDMASATLKAPFKPLPHKAPDVSETPAARAVTL